jgi:hypothetical protein
VNLRDPSGRQRSLSATVVVVACSAIESVRLLMLSAEISPEFNSRINHNDLLGKYFLTHCFGGASAVMPGRFDKSLTVDSDWATDFCGSEDFIRSNGLWAGATIYNNTSDQALPIALGRTTARRSDIAGRADTIRRSSARDFARFSIWSLIGDCQ